MYFNYFGYLKNTTEYDDMIVSLKQEVDEFLEVYHEDSRLLSGWGHGYFCDEDGGRLIYNRQNPYSHQCSICGKIFREYQYNACHVTMMRNEAVVTAIKCGLLYKITQETKYVEVVKAIIGYFAENYEGYAIHAKDKISCSLTEDVGGAGKIMPQGLNEAIILIRMVNAMELVKEALDCAWIDGIKKNLYTPGFELLLPQKQHIHNIPTWINSAIGVMGFFFKDEAWIKEATENPFNLFEQLEQGVTESGFWYEGSIHYNFFALEGIMNFFVFAEAYGYEIPSNYQDIVFHMLDAAYKYAFDNDILPNPSDGWPNVSLKTYLHVYYMGYHALGERVLPYLKHIESNPAERPTLPLSEPYYYRNRIPLERLLFAPDIDKKNMIELEQRLSESFEASNCTILRNEVYNLFFKYGHQTTSHAHPDKMNVEIMVGKKVLTKDLSNSGYASRLCNEWHRNIASHNTCVIDGKASDIEHGGQLIGFGKQHVKATAEAYENVWYTRELTLDGPVLSDVFEVQAEKKACMDWFFHFEILVDRENLKLTPANLFQEYGEGNIQNCMEIISEDGKLVLENELVTMEVELESGMRAYLAKTYNNPADKMRDTIIIRKTDSCLRIGSTIRAKQT